MWWLCHLGSADGGRGGGILPPSMGPCSYVGLLKICVFCSGNFYVKRQHGRRAKRLLAFSLTVIATEPFGVRRMKFGSAMEICRATRLDYLRIVMEWCFEVSYKRGDCTKLWGYVYDKLNQAVAISSKNTVTAFSNVQVQSIKCDPSRIQSCDHLRTSRGH
jgi:hypothetical protein